MTRIKSVSLFGKQWVNLYLLLAILWCVTMTALSATHSFFWDTIQLGSKHAHFYFENQFSQFLLPTEIDSGHPPYFGMYLALCWKIFGKSLQVSHWAMLPFLLVFVFQWFYLGRRLIGRNLLPFFLLFLLIDPVVAGQASLVSPDVILAGCFLLLINSIYANNSTYKVLAVLGLGMISTRGMMVAFLVFLWEFLTSREKLSENSWWKELQSLINPYLPGGILALIYLLYHYISVGWIGYHAESEWAPSFAQADLRQFMKNIAVLVWRFLDFGRIFIFAGILIGATSLWKNNRLRKGKIDPELRRMALLLALLLLGLGIPFLSYAGLQQHRYLLPPFLLATMLLFQLIKELTSDHWHRRKKHGLVAIISIGLLSGNLWIYPDWLSQGWDSTLAHWPYYELRAEMSDFVQAQEIGMNEIGTAFPEIGPLKYKDLNELKEGYKEKDLRADQYILYSNIMNDFSNAERWRLEEEWNLIHEIRSRGIKMILYQRPAEE